MTDKILVKGSKGLVKMTDAAFKIAHVRFGATEYKPEKVITREIPPEITGSPLKSPIPTEIIKPKTDDELKKEAVNKKTKRSYFINEETYRKIVESGKKDKYTFREIPSRPLKDIPQEITGKVKQPPKTTKKCLFRKKNHWKKVG